MTERGRPPFVGTRLAFVGRIGLLASVYVATAWVGLHLGTVAGFATLVWPPTGISLAAMLLWGRRLWPGVALGAFVVNVCFGAPPAAALGIAVGNTLEAYVAAIALDRLVGFHCALDRIRDVAALAGLAAVLSTVLSATIGVTSLWLAGRVPDGLFGESWIAWWSGDLAADLLVAPLLLTAFCPAPTRDGHRAVRAVESFGLALTLALAAVVVLFEWAPQLPELLRKTYYFFPILTWAAVRFGPRGSAAASFALAFLTTFSTARGWGPFAMPVLHEGLTAMQTFLTASAFTALLLAASVREREDQRRAARDSEARKGAILEAAIDAVITIDHKGIIREFNAAAERLFRYRRTDVEGCEMASRIIPERLRESHRRGFARFLETGDGPVLGTRVHFPAARSDGTEFPAEIAITRVGGTVPPLFTGFVRDLTAQQEAERELRQSREELERKVEERTAALQESLHEKEALLREIHHRVKNNLQVIASLLHLQATTGASAASQAAFQESQLRIRAMALVHQLLYQSKDLARIDFGDYLRSLVGQIFQGYGIVPNRVSARVETGEGTLHLDVDTAVPCGLIVTELVSNSLRHAFPGGRRGRVTVSLRRESDRSFELTVRDDGVGITGETPWITRQTLGLQLVRSLTKQIRGTIEHVRDGGTCFRLVFVVD